jgi:hypothetical protein
MIIGDVVNKRLCLLFVLLGFSVSCTAIGDNSNDLPGVTIPLQEMNTAFMLEDDPILANSHKNGQDLALVMRNLSHKTIVLPSDYGLIIFEFQNQSWNPVENGFLYTGGDKKLPTSDAFPPGLMAIAYPYIPGLSEPTDIRIVMIGYYENSDLATIGYHENRAGVGAYLDITLLP